MSASTLCEMTRLQLSRPAVNAPAVVVAAWYARKAALLEHLAAEGTAGAWLLAGEAHRHAARLLVHVPGPAAASAKNTTAGPGLPTPFADDSRRTLMVSAPSALTTRCVSAVAGGGGR